MNILVLADLTIDQLLNAENHKIKKNEKVYVLLRAFYFVTRILMCHT